MGSGGRSEILMTDPPVQVIYGDHNPHMRHKLVRCPMIDVSGVAPALIALAQVQRKSLLEAGLGVQCEKEAWLFYRNTACCPVHGSNPVWNEPWSDSDQRPGMGGMG